MEKTTRMDFIRTLKEYKKVCFCGLLTKTMIRERIINILDKSDISDFDFSEVEFTSNAMKRKTEDGYSWLYFEKGDEVYKHEGDKYIVYFYQTFNTMIYVIKKEGIRK